MPNWVIILIVLIAAVIFLTASWWGVRKLRQKHSRSAVAQETHSAKAGPQKVVVIINPAKNKAAQARSMIAQACLEAGWSEPLFLETTVKEPGYSQAQQAMEYGADVVLVGGGDGTVRRVAEVLSHSPVAMGLIPLGTGNLLARNLNMDVTNLQDNVFIALFGHQRHIDTAVMEVENSRTAENHKHSFLVIAGIGVDAKVVADTKDQLKKNVGWLAYGEAGVRHIPGKRTKVSITLDDETEQHRKVRSVLFGNCGLLPGGLDFIPDAVIDDGILNIVVMSPRSAIGWLSMLAKVMFKHSRALPVMDYYRTQKITVRSPDPLEIQVDGDACGAATKLTVVVQPHALLVRVKPS